MLITGILTTMVTVKVFLVMTNPDLFLRPAVEAAALEIATVCDGKYNARTLTPAPGGASYVISTCADRNLMVTGTAAVGIIQIATLVNDLANLGKGLKNTAGKLKENGADWGKILQKVTWRGKDEMVVPKELLDALKGTDDALGALAENADEITGLANGMGEGVEMASDFKRAVKNSQDEAKQTREILESAVTEGDNLILDCSGDKRELCESVFSGHRSIGKTAKASEQMIDSINILENDLRGIGKLSDSLAKSYTSLVIKDKVLDFRRTLNQLDDVMISFKNGVDAIKKTVLDEGVSQIVTRNFWRVQNLNQHLRISGLILGTVELFSTDNNFEVIMDYLGSRGGYFSILETSFTGVAFTSNIIAVVNNTEDEIGRLANESLVLSGNLTNTSEFIIDKGIKFLSSKGYYTTAEFLGSLESTEVIPIGKTTNINSEIILTAMQEYLDRAEELCESETCIDHLLDVVDSALDFSIEQGSLNDLLTVAEEYPSEIAKEGVKFVDVLTKFLEFEQGTKTGVDAVYDMRNQVGDWVGNNCDTEILNFEEYGDVEVSDCAMIFDCSPKSFCFVGLPIVNIDLQDDTMSEPLYIPITYLNEEDSVSAATVIGLNYDSALKVITPGDFLGCPGEFLSTTSLFICASIPGSRRCKVVNCEKEVVPISYSFYPNVDVTLENDSVKIWGNFMTW